MSDNIIKNDYGSNFTFTSQNITSRNMSAVPQQSTRPNTLPINDSTLFTSNDYSKYFFATSEVDERLRGYTTPDLINALTTQIANDGQPSPGLFG